LFKSLKIFIYILITNNYGFEKNHDQSMTEPLTGQWLWQLDRGSTMAKSW